MRLTRQVLLIGALLSAAAAQPAKADCRLEPDVRFPAARELVAMQPITVTWSRCGTASVGGPPAFLIISLPDAVRLQGNGFFALRPGARAPFGIDFRRETLRIVVPLHLPTTAARGTIKVTPLRAGALSIESGVVTRSDDGGGWSVASPSQTSINVAPGPPELRVCSRPRRERPRRCGVRSTGGGSCASSTRTTRFSTARRAISFSVGRAPRRRCLRRSAS